MWAAPCSIVRLQGILLRDTPPTPPTVKFMILFFGLWKTFDHRQQNLPRVRCLDFSLSTHCYSLLPLQSELPLELEGPERHRDSTCCRLQLLTLVCRLHPGTFGPLLVKFYIQGFSAQPSVSVVDSRRMPRVSLPLVLSNVSQTPTPSSSPTPQPNVNYIHDPHAWDAPWFPDCIGLTDPFITIHEYEVQEAFEVDTASATSRKTTPNHVVKWWVQTCTGGPQHHRQDQGDRTRGVQRTNGNHSTCGRNRTAKAWSSHRPPCWGFPKTPTRFSMQTPT